MPATVVITEPFEALAAGFAARLGAPGYHAVVVPHPVSSRDDDQLRAFAARGAGPAQRQLLG